MTTPDTLARPQSPDAAASGRHRYLVCRPDNYAVRYVINPWMEGNIDRAEPGAARTQWADFHAALSAAGDLEVLSQPPGVPDFVFTANAGLVLRDKVVLSHFRHPERQAEEPFFARWFRGNGFDVTEMPRGMYFEGAGDALFLRDSGILVMGYGFRTVLESASYVSSVLDVEVVPVRLSDDRFYHLDTCFCPLTGGKLIWYPAAFDDRSVKAIEALVPAENRHAVSDADAMAFACNAVDTGDTVQLNRASDELVRRLEGWGFRVVQTPLDQFMLAGGSGKCLTLRLDEPHAHPRRQDAPAIPSREIEFRGHVFDTGTLQRVMDHVPEAGGSYSVQRFEPGFAQEDPSYIRLRISAPAEETLEDILRELVSLGGHVAEEGEGEATLATVENPGVAPDDFYSTTIFRTEVRLGGVWVPVERQRMDAVVVAWEESGGWRAECRLLRDLRPGEKIVVGTRGLRVHARREAVDDEFKFMGSAVSSERRVESVVEHVAWEMKRLRDRGGRIVWVAGPVVIHTGGGPYLARLAHQGYVSALLGGNAIAVHDLESQLYGTSLGVDLKRGKAVSEGHRHHINTINTIRRCGSIRAAVEQGVIGGGLFYELVRAGVPYCLAGSIRDDGPLPDTVMDLVEAQRQYQELLHGSEMVIMLSSMLHSIGVGNMTPAGVRLICVDINPSVATKLADRGSVDSTPVVTDVGLFLNLLSRQLG